MKNVLRTMAAYLVLVAALFSFVPGLAGSAAAQAGARVAAIEFKGNRTLSSEVLRQSLRTKVGAPLDESLLNEDIKTLYDLFATVQLQREQEGDQVRLTFVVTETPLAADVRLNGVSAFTDSEVRAIMDTVRGRPIADFRVQNDARKIERLYRLRGYRFVQVDAQVEDTDAGKTVTFTVLEGPQVDVAEITFVGNESFPEAKLLEWMGTQETGFLGLSGAPFVEETLVKDRTSLVNFLRREGHLDATVQIDPVEFSEDRSEAFITIRIQEGPAFTIGNLAIVGADSFPGGADALRPLLTLEPGRRFRSADVQDSISAIETAYREEGYYSVVVDTSDKVAGTTVDLTFRVDEQSKVRVRNLWIVGNEITQDKVIRREITVFPGEVLNLNEIEKSKNRLEALDYFTRVTADVIEPKEGDDPNLRDVRFEVDDTAKTGQIRFAVGASSDLGLLASITVTKRNFDWRDWPERFSDVLTGRAFTGAGQTFQLELSPGSEFSSYRLGFTEPWLFDKPISFSWDLFFSKFTRFDYDVDRRGLDFTLGRRFTFEGRRVDTVLGVSGTTRLEHVDLSAIQDDSAPTAFLAEGGNSLISERLAFRLDRVDNTRDPTSGWFAQYTPEFGFAGDVRLFKNELEARRFWTVKKDENERLHTLQIGARLGYVSPQGSSVEADPNLFDTSFVPTYERFFAGGTMDYQVRGFAFGGAGPHGKGDPFLTRRPGETATERDIRVGNTAFSVLENDGDPMGGNLAFVANAQYGFPLYEDVLGGVVFVDTGLVRDSAGSSHGLDEDVVDRVRDRLASGGPRRRQLARLLEFDDGGSFFDDLRVSVGFGFRIKIPAFGSTPIALDFGFPIRKRDGDDTQVLSFSIARDF